MSEQNERYARADVQGGYLYNKSEIDYFKQTQALDVVSNLMLGDFNKKGTYIISEGIIKELINVKKVYQYSFGSTTFCQSMNDIGGFGKIDFAIKIRNNNQNGTVSATLQLLETVDRANGYYQNTNTASIATYTAKESNTFIVEMLKYFNVVSKKDTGFLKKEKEEDIDLIIARKKYEDLVKKGSNEKIDAIFKSLYEKRLKILAKSEVGKKILADFNSETYKINGWFVKEGMPGYYRYLNQILDGLFEVNSEKALQDVALTASWRKSSEMSAVELAKIMASVAHTLVASAKELGNEAIIEQQNKSMQNVLSVDEKPTTDAKSKELPKQNATANEIKPESKQEERAESIAGTINAEALKPETPKEKSAKATEILNNMNLSSEKYNDKMPERSNTDSLDTIKNSSDGYLEEETL